MDLRKWFPVLAVILFFLFVIAIIFSIFNTSPQQHQNAHPGGRRDTTQDTRQSGKKVRFGVQKTRLFDEEAYIDCEDKNVKSRDSSLDLKDPRYQLKLRN